nr:MAG TPA: hypothetical protein [Caudoviricetes sp.]
MTLTIKGIVPFLLKYLLDLGYQKAIRYVLSG